MDIILPCFSTDQRELLDEMESEYCKFNGLEELPDNVYQAFYWLSRYSNLVTRKIHTKEENPKIAQQTHTAICDPCPESCGTLLPEKCLIVKRCHKQQ